MEQKEESKLRYGNKGRDRESKEIKNKEFVEKIVNY